MFDEAQNKPSTRFGSAILCGYLIDSKRYVESRAQCKNPRLCEACGADYYTICGLYNAPLQFLSQRGF